MEDAGDYFSLKWSNFRSSLTEGFHDFLQEEAMVDVTLAAEGKFVQAHKLVLSVCSPYFKNLFKVNPCKHPIVFLKDVGLNDLSYMLEFMYKGEVGVKHEDLPSFLKLADTLKVKGLAGEKIQKDENCTSNNLDSNVARIRNKVSRDSVSDLSKENSEFQSCSEKKIRKRKKFSCKSKLVKKLKSEKCVVESVDKCAGKSSGDVSEDEEDNNPLIKFVRGDSVKSGSSLKQSAAQCGNENESQCDNKMNYSVWSDDIPDSDDSGGPDINSLFQSDYSEEAEQAPQDEGQADVNSESSHAVRVKSIAHFREGFSEKLPDRGPATGHGEARLDGKLHVMQTGIKRDCKVCSKRNTLGGRRQTTYFCNTCPDKPRMHLGDCFLRCLPQPHRPPVLPRLELLREGAEQHGRLQDVPEDAKRSADDPGGVPPESQTPTGSCSLPQAEGRLAGKEEENELHLHPRGRFHLNGPFSHADDAGRSSLRVREASGHLSSLVISRAPRAFVWDYFLKETHQAICLNCGKTFKGQRPNTICEQHLKRRHPEFYKILLEKKIKRAELHMNPMIMGLGVPSYDQD